MKQTMIFTQLNNATVTTYYDEEKNQIVLKHNIFLGINEVKVFDDPKNALVDFLTYLLDYAKEIVLINEELFKIPSDEHGWMKDHPRYDLLMNQLECLKGKL